jgi:hypothetical protein
MKKPLISIFLLLLCSTACKTTGPKGVSTFDGRHTSFGVNRPPLPWQQKTFRGADLYFENTENKASMYFNSECLGVSDSPLEALTAQLMVGLTNVTIISQNTVELAEREAMVSEVHAKLDGVARQFLFMVMRKNSCVYDGALSTNALTDAERTQFMATMSSFWAKAAL